MKIKIEEVGMIKIYCDGILMIEERTIGEVMNDIERIDAQINNINEKIIVEKIRKTIKEQKEWLGAM